MYQWILGFKRKLHKLAVYQKAAAEIATLSFLVFSFFQHFDQNIINTLTHLLPMQRVQWEQMGLVTYRTL